MTIDGVAASGKSSVASGVAQALGIPYLSSGLLYRAATRLALEAELDVNDAPALLRLLAERPLRLLPLPEGNRIYLEGAVERDLTADAHTSAVDAQVSAVARLPEVREWVNAQLRAVPPPFVAEGRDMGTAVFPGAQAKFLPDRLTAHRAQRRRLERQGRRGRRGGALSARDEQDRLQSRPAPDAQVIDTGALDLEGVIQTVLAGIEAQSAEAGERKF